MFPIKKSDSVLITGGAGFIGTNIVNKLINLKYSNINLIVKDSTNLQRLKNTLSKINIHKADLLDKEGLQKIVNKVKPSVILHLATYSEYKDQEVSLKMTDINIKGTLNFLMSTKNINYDIFINTGSSSEYGIKKRPMKESDILEPVSFYSATKASATLLCQVFAKEYNKPIVTLRPFSVYGPYEDKKRFIPTIVRAIFKNKPIKLTSGNQRRDFIFVEDVVDIYIKTISHGSKLRGQILNMGTGKEYSNDEVVKTLFRITSKSVKIIKGAYPKRIWDASHWVADISKTKRLLNWKPNNSLLDGLKKTYEWYKHV